MLVATMNAGARGTATIFPNINEPKASGPVWRQQKRAGKRSSKKSSEPKWSESTGTLPTADEYTGQDCDVQHGDGEIPTDSAATATDDARAVKPHRTTRRIGKSDRTNQRQVAEEWLSSLLKTQWNQSKDADDQRERVHLGISREALHQAGLSHTAIDRVYRSLYVYTTGFHQMVTEIAAKEIHGSEKESVTTDKQGESRRARVVASILLGWNWVSSTLQKEAFSSVCMLYRCHSSLVFYIPDQCA
eukprot:SAG31_NODE_183_length_20987_cov_8.711078_2_plen_246_part_00